MSWSAIVSGILAVVAFIRELLAFKQSADDRQAGADAAINAGRKEEDDALARTQAAIDESDTKPIDYRD
jgi:hypothetical protein